MTAASEAQAWLFVREGALPASWQERAVPVLMVPLLADEADDVLSGESAAPRLDPVDERIVHFLARGLSENEIAGEMGLNVRTVQRRLLRLRERYGAETTRELAAGLAGRGFSRGMSRFPTSESRRNPRAADETEERQASGGAGRAPSPSTPSERADADEPHTD